VSGEFHENVEFKAQYDFAGGAAGFKDVYLAFKTGLGTVTVGNHYVPLGFEEQVSSKYMTFMERSVVNTFNPSRQNGVSLGNDVGEWNWRLGMFRPSDGFGNDLDNSGDGEWNFFGRVAGRPWVDKENEQYLHVGASAGLLRYAGEEVRYRQRPEVHISPRFVDTGDISAQEGTVWDLEGAFVSGPFHSEIEYSRVDVNVIDDSDVTFDALSISAGMFLTGESRPYKGSFFGRVKPKKNWGEEGGNGAWEVAARWSTIDLNDGAIEGESMDIITLGVNWYMNPNTRIMLNVNFIDPDAEDTGKVHAVQLRFQIDF
jgi:phosphate-selective porin OprO/OprP